MSELFKKDIPVVAPEFRVPRNSGTIVPYVGNQARHIAMATFDPSANTGERTVAAHGLGVYIPSKAIITNAWYDVITTFTTASADSGTIALSVEGAGDLKAAIAVSAAGDVWDAGIRGCLPGSYAEATVAGDTAVLDAARKAASYVKTTAERELTATVATAALTAGKLNLFVEYVLSA